MTLPLDWMAASFRHHGLKVKEEPGWRSRGRPYTFTPHGVVFHHTASARTSGPAPAVGTVINGRPDITGPLCNILVARDSRVHLIAAGYANHAGYGGPWGDIPQDSGNRYTVGIEVENDGIGEPWPGPQLDTVAHVGAILLHHFDRSRFYFFGHKEWAPTRKIDPARIDMDHFRKGRLKHYMKALNKRAA